MAAALPATASRVFVKVGPHKWGLLDNAAALGMHPTRLLEELAASPIFKNTFPERTPLVDCQVRVASASEDGGFPADHAPCVTVALIETLMGAALRREVGTDATLFVFVDVPAFDCECGHF